MKLGSAKPATVIAVALSLLWIVLFCISLVADNAMFTWIVIGIAPAAVLFLILFIKPDLFLFMTVFFIPLSLKLDLSGGFKVSFPDQVMAVLLLLYFILNFSKIHIPDRKIFRHPVFIILIVYLSWLVIVSATSDIPLVSFKHTFIQILYFCICFLLFLTKFDKTENILKFYLFYALGMIIPVIHGMIWHSHYHFNPQASYYMPQPFFIEHTVYGAALAFIIPVLIYLVFFRNRFNATWAARIGLGLLLLLIVTAEFLSYSRAAWLSLLILPLAFLGLRIRISPRLLFAGFLVIAFVAYLNLETILTIFGRNEARSNRGNIKEQIESVSNIQTDISNLERINRWKSAFRMFEDRPLTGHGPGTYQFVYYRYQVKKEMTRISTYHGEKGNAHSEYLGFLSETGIPGLLIYLSLIFVSISISIRIIYTTHDKLIRNIMTILMLSLMTFYIHTIFNGFIETDKVGSLVFGSLAAITALDVYFFRKEHEKSAVL